MAGESTGDAPEARLGQTIREAAFDRRLAIYWFLHGNIIFVVTIIGIVLLPLWWLFGYLICFKRWKSLGCVLTEKALVVRAGILFKVEKTVLLEKIQDVTLTEGPLLNAFGLCSIHVETAGGSGGGGSANLTGIVGAREFRDAVLRQCEVVKNQESASALPLPVATTPGDEAAVELLRDMRDTLRRIERKLGGE